MSSPLRARVQADMKTALKARESVRLEAIRLLLARIKQVEIDEKTIITDDVVMKLLNKQVKMFREAMTQYENAGRDDLLSKEKSQLEALQVYLPTPLTEDELSTLIDQALAETDAQAAKDMGKVMACLKPKIEGRADISQVSKSIKARLS